ncbi:MAG: N-formylglutamate amidohydrolase [Rhodobacterales bacterium]|nr:N-formylglutamate amidohydrolase [Rhodobacterales bacterium]
MNESKNMDQYFPNTDTQTPAPSLIPLADGDPDLFTVYNPEGKAPLLLVCDHASRAIPTALEQLGLPPEAFNLHIAYDIGAAAVTRKLADRLDCMAVLAGYSRLLIDCNRQPGDPQSIPEVSDGHRVPGNQGLSESEQVARVEAFHLPYHHAITTALAHLWRHGPPPALFSVHSFTPTLNGQDRHWDIGVLWNRDPRLAVPLVEKLRAAGRKDDRPLHVGDNEPYSGRDLAYTIDLHAGAGGLANCAVEIRQDHLETEDEADHWADMLADALADIMAMENIHVVQRY